MQLVHACVVEYGPWQNPPSESHWPFPHALAQQLFLQVIGVSFGAYAIWLKQTLENNRTTKTKNLYMICYLNEQFKYFS
jgi:hypothetical protein